ALEECYRGMLERGRHPVAVVNLTVAPEEVDVNVHPAKREVRFRREGDVFTALQRAVHAALGGGRPYELRIAPAAPAPWSMSEPEVHLAQTALLDFETVT